MDKPYAITLHVGSSLANKTGAWRTKRPLYVDRLPPCNSACPAGENVQAWLAEAQAGQFREAWEIIVRDNPMPAVHGRVCYHPCEDTCNRKDVDESVKRAAAWVRENASDTGVGAPKVSEGTAVINFP